MRTLEPKRQSRNWEPLAKALPVLAILFTFAFIIFAIGVMQYVGGNY